MTPAFDVEGGLRLALARAGSVAGLMAAFGSLVYQRVIAPRVGPPIAARLDRLGLYSLAAALVGTLVWLFVQTGVMAGDHGPSSLWTVLTQTLFGHLLGARFVLLVMALVLRRRSAAPWLAGAALLLQAGHSHAMAMGGRPALLASSALHLLAAGIWLGALPGLLVVIAAHSDAAGAARRFSAAGLACVAVLLSTAAFQYVVLVIDVPGLVGTAYGWMVALKMALFAGLIGLAARNRLVLSPRLHAQSARRALCRAIALEMALGLAVVGAAGVLTELPPAMHIQKLWPFPVVPSLVAAREDPDIAREMALAGAALVLGLAVLAGAIAFRRRRWRALAAALAACLTMASALPHLSPLLVPAVPTLFYRSPTGFSAAAILRGAVLYPTQCAACHGAGGHGDGPLAATLPIPPADLTAAHLWAHADGELFWWLTHGIDGPRSPAMPGFSALTEDDRWALIDVLHARNAGATLGRAGWAIPLQAPDFPMTCTGAPTRLSSQRGRIVLLFLAGPPTPAPGAVTVRVAGEAPDSCRADDSAVAEAYAAAAPHARSVLIDANGWLRAAAMGDTPPDLGLAAPPLPKDRALPDMPAGMKM